jgi:hypothetical protein
MTDDEMKAKLANEIAEINEALSHKQHYSANQLRVFRKRKAAIKRKLREYLQIIKDKAISNTQLKIFKTCLSTKQ